MKTKLLFLLTPYLMMMTLLTALSGCSSSRSRSGSRDAFATPEATVVAFTKAAIRHDVEFAQRCFLPGGVDYNDIRETLLATPASRRYQARVMIESLDPDVAMPIVSKTETEHGTRIVWRVTFKRDCKVSEGGGHLFKARSTYDFDATLKKAEDRWLIDNF